MGVQPERETFFLPGQGEDGILLIHGLTANPFVLRPAAERLNGEGFHVCAPRLPGHGTDPGDLLTVTWKDWFETVIENYELLKAHCRNVHVIGMSLGGNLALCLSAQCGDGIKKIVSIGAPIILRHQWYVKTFLPIYSLFRTYHKKTDVNLDRQYYEESGAYTVWPYHSLYQLLELIEETKKSMQHVGAQTLIFHSTRDPVVHPHSAQYIFDNLTTPAEQKKSIVLHDRNHANINGALYPQIISFLKEQD